MSISDRELQRLARYLGGASRVTGCNVEQCHQQPLTGRHAVTQRWIETRGADTYPNIRGLVRLDSELI
jgi:hypothetical protein